MVLFDFGKRKHLLELQKLLFSDSPDKLKFSEQQLQNFANERVQRYLNDIQKNIETVNTTTDVDKYFNCFDTTIALAELLVKYEPFVNFSGQSPSESLESVKQKEQTSIKMFLNRYCQQYYIIAIEYKTNKEKQAIYEDFFNNLSPYIDRMDVYNCNFIKTDCKDKILSNRISVKDIDVSDEIEQAIKVVIETGQASTSMIQRRLNIGYARAGRMIDDMETLGVVGPHQGARPRDVLMTYIDWVNLPKKYYYKPYDIVENKKEIKQYNDLEYIDNELDGYGFESYCSELLKKNGFQDTKVTKASNDYGADIIAVKEGVRYAIQCKKYSNPVGITAIQEVIASKSIYDCHVAVVLTNSTFTNNAIELANKNGVLLWDRTYLSKLIQKN